MSAANCSFEVRKIAEEPGFDIIYTNADGKRYQSLDTYATNEAAEAARAEFEAYGTAPGWDATE